MPKWQMQAITSQDLDQILTIDRSAFKQPWGRNLFSEELSCKNAFSYLIRSASSDECPAIIAYVFLRVHVHINEMHIIRIAVAPNFRFMGVATRLLRQCFKLAQQNEVHTVFIEVRPSNKAAIALYRKLGFQLIHRRPNYYPESNEDAMVMAKHVKESL